MKTKKMYKKNKKKTNKLKNKRGGGVHGRYTLA